MKAKTTLPKGGAAGYCAPCSASGDTACVMTVFSGKEAKFRKADKYPEIVQAQVHSRSGSANNGKGGFLGELYLPEERKALYISFPPCRPSLKPKLRIL